MYECTHLKDLVKMFFGITYRNVVHHIDLSFILNTQEITINAKDNEQHNTVK